MDGESGDGLVVVEVFGVEVEQPGVEGGGEYQGVVDVVAELLGDFWRGFVD